MSNRISKGTLASIGKYNLSEAMYYWALLFGVPFILALIFAFATMYFGESLFIKHHLFSAYIDNFASGSKYTYFEGEKVSRLHLISVAAKHIEAAHIWQIFYGLVVFFYALLFLPIRKLINHVIGKIEESKKEKYIRGSKVIEGEDYADKQIKEGKNKGIVLSPIFEFSEEYENVKVEGEEPAGIKQFKGKEVQYVQK